MNTVEDRIQHPQFRNWVKSALTLYFARDALREFVETKNKTNHELLIKGIPTACSSCDFNTCATCQNNACTNKHIKQHIKISHCQPNPSFENTNPKECLSEPWEFAKCFMPPHGYRGIQTAGETDFLGLVSVVVNNWDFRAAISNNDSKFIKARDMRNQIMHNPSFEVDDQTFKDYLDVINNMLISIQMTETTKTALSRIDELCRGTLTITAEDIARVINEAVASLKLLSVKIIDSISDMSRLSELCTQTIKDEVIDGVNTIKQQTDEGVVILSGKTLHGLEDIKKEREEATDQLNAKTEEGFNALASQTIEKACQLQALHNDSTVALRETAERERNAIKMKAEQEITEIQREKKLLESIMKDSIKYFDNEIYKIQETKTQTENARDDISQNRGNLHRSSSIFMNTVRDVTKACFESLHKETETLRSFIRESNSQLEHDKQNDIENIRTEFRDELLEVLREIRELKNKMEDTIACKETISEETNTLMTFKGDSKSVSELDIPIGYNNTHMAFGGILQEGDRYIIDGNSGQEDMISRMDSISQESEHIGNINSSLEDNTLNKIEDKSMELSGIKIKEERVLSDGTSRPRRVIDHLDIQLDSDKRCPYIKAIVKAGVDELAVVDYNNDRVKIINVRTNTITSFVDVHHPMDITYVNDNLLVVACTRVLQFLELRDGKLFIQKKRFKLNDCAQPLGVDYTNVDKLFAVYLSPDVVRIINLDGTTLREIQIKLDIITFHYATIKLSTDGKRLYVIDETEYSVLCLSIRDGTILHRYKQGSLHPPVGFDEDIAGNVYIAEKKSSIIHIFSPDGSHLAIRLKAVKGFEYQSSITYCHQEHALYVCYRALGKECVSIHPLKHIHTYTKKIFL